MASRRGKGGHHTHKAVNRTRDKVKARGARGAAVKASNQIRAMVESERSEPPSSSKGQGGIPIPPTPAFHIVVPALGNCRTVEEQKGLLRQLVSQQLLTIIDTEVARKAPVEAATATLESGSSGLSAELEGSPATSAGVEMPHLWVPEYERELARLQKIYCPAMIFCGQFLSEWFFIPPSGMHDAMLRAITETDTQRHQLIIGPRELGKTPVALGGELYDGLMLRRLTTTHMSVTDRLAQKKLALLITQLEENKLLQNAFGIMPGKTTRQDEFQIKVGLRHPTTVTFQAIGFGGSVRGERESRIVGDDIDSKEDSPQTWEKNYLKIKGTVMGALRNTDDAFKGQVVMLGNYIGDGSTIDKLETIDAVELPEHWQVHKFSAIELGPTQHITKVPIGRSVWPQYLSTKELLEKRRVLNMGEAWSFEMEYMNQKVNPANRVWEREMFVERYDELPPRHRLAANVAIDGTDSQSTASDNVGIVSIAKCLEGEQDGFYYVLDCRIAKLTPNDTASEAMRQYIGRGTKSNTFCDSAYVEDKSDKGIGALQQVILTKTRTNNVNMNLQRVVPKTYGDKRRRALKVVDIGRTGRILFPKHLSPDLKKLIEQLVMFTGTTSQGNLPGIDDGHDAFVWCLLMLIDVETSNDLSGKIIIQGGKVRAPGAAPIL